MRKARSSKVACLFARTRRILDHSACLVDRTARTYLICLPHIRAFWTHESSLFGQMLRIRYKEVPQLETNNRIQTRIVLSPRVLANAVNMLPPPL